MRKYKSIPEVHTNDLAITTELEQKIVMQKMLEKINEKLDGPLKPSELQQLSRALLNLHTAEISGRFTPYDPNAFHITC